MKVYILREHNEENLDISEIMEVFDSLEEAQAYREGKPEDWQADPHARGWWDRKIIVTKFGVSITLHLSIAEWEVKTKPVDQDELDQTYCVECQHLIGEHGKYGCDHHHNQPDWMAVGCTCKIIVYRSNEFVGSYS